MNGQQFLTQTFDSNPYLTHDLVLAYGLLNWVTKGVFLGDYHVYATQEIDDFFIDDSEWIPSTTCLTNLVLKDRTLPDASNLPVFRVDAADMTQLVGLANDQASRSVTLARDDLRNRPNLGKIRADHRPERRGHVGKWRLERPDGSHYRLVGDRREGELYRPRLLWLAGAVRHRNQHQQWLGRAQRNLDDRFRDLQRCHHPRNDYVHGDTHRHDPTPPTLATATELGVNDNPATATAVVADDLVANLQNYQSNFHWISHTYDHPSP